MKRKMIAERKNVQTTKVQCYLSGVSVCIAEASFIEVGDYLHVYVGKCCLQPLYKSETINLNSTDYTMDIASLISGISHVPSGNFMELKLDKIMKTFRFSGIKSWRIYNYNRFFQQ